MPSKKRRLLIIFAALATLSASLTRGEGDAESAIRDRTFADLSANPPKISILPENVGKVRALLWEKYREMVKDDPIRKQEDAQSKIRFNGKVLKYQATPVAGEEAEAPGKKPLYIAMHGGGGGPSRMNDSQWKHMTRYYLKNVKEGIYLAPRGMTDTWNLHFVDETYVAYDRLIENMIAFHDVDPNRVYILGFSAGGDGTYQIPTRMPDRWAAANMSAGHPNGVSPKNLFSVPFLIQVGERDGAYKRNRVAVEYFLKLEEWAAGRQGFYVHDAFVHVNKPHNFYDNHPTEEKQMVLKSPKKWLASGDREAVKKNTSAIRWLSRHTRNPYPTTIFWDLKTGADRSGVGKDGKSLWSVKHKGRQCYWLDLADVAPEEAGCDEIIASYNKVDNSVVLSASPKKVVILLHEDMVDFSKDIVLSVQDKKVPLQVKPSMRTMIRTLAERGDPNYCFAAEIEIAR